VPRRPKGRRFALKGLAVQRPTRVVFDIGNVLLNWDVRALYRSIFADPAEMEHFLTVILPPEWNLEQDRGRSWAEAETAQIALHPAHAGNIRAFRARWHETITGDIPGTVDILRRLKSSGVPLYAITNFASDTFREAQARFPFLADSFIDIVISGDERVIKPDPRIYRILLDRQGLDAHDCVFVDDSEENVRAAAALGFHALRFTTPEAFRDALRALGFDV
jgi:2-haloacid dehalogenase